MVNRGCLEYALHHLNKLIKGRLYMNISDLNIELFRFINDIGKHYTIMNPIFIGLAEYTVYVLAFVLLLYWFTQQHSNRLMVISAVMAFGLAELAGKAVSILHSNLQPFAELANVNQLIEKEVNNSFPSDHTILFISVTITIWLFRRRATILWVIIGCLASISRIGVGVHYPADVLVGGMIAVISAIAAYVMVRKLRVITELLNKCERMEKIIKNTIQRSN